jgi:hypothetical protein
MKVQEAELERSASLRNDDLMLRNQVYCIVSWQARTQRRLLLQAFVVRSSWSRLCTSEIFMQKILVSDKKKE